MKSMLKCKKLLALFLALAQLLCAVPALAEDLPAQAEEIFIAETDADAPELLGAEADETVVAEYGEVAAAQEEADVLADDTVVAGAAETVDAGDVMLGGDLYAETETEPEAESETQPEAQPVDEPETAGDDTVEPEAEPEEPDIDAELADGDEEPVDEPSDEDDEPAGENGEASDAEGEDADEAGEASNEEGEDEDEGIVTEEEDEAEDGEEGESDEEGEPEETEDEEPEEIDLLDALSDGDEAPEMPEVAEYDGFTWSMLQERLNDSEITQIQLGNDIVATADDGPLIVRHDVTIDLNGHMINRNLTTAKYNGYVIEVYGGHLTITDSSTSKDGMITGGNNTGVYDSNEVVQSAFLDTCGGVLVDDKTMFTLAGGRIAGNKTDGVGGGVNVKGTFNMEGGTIEGNTAVEGGGVHVDSTGFFTMSDGTITDNIAGSDAVPGTEYNGAGGGSGVFTKGTFNMNTGGEIDNNPGNTLWGDLYVAGGSANIGISRIGFLRYMGGDVYLSGTPSIGAAYLGQDKAFHLNYIQEGGSPIKVTTEIHPNRTQPVRIATNSHADADANQFASELEGFVVARRSDMEELWLGEGCSVSFDANGGSGNMTSINALAGSSIELPACDFNPPEGQNMEFAAWQLGDVTYAPGDSISPEGDVTVKATWKRKPIDYVNAKGEAMPAVENYEVLHSDSTSWNQNETNKGWFVVLEDTTIVGRVSINPNADLLLCNGATLTILGGIRVSDQTSLRIWQQNNYGDAGRLFIEGVDGAAAGIGSDSSYGGRGNIIINGGNILVPSGGLAIGNYTGDSIDQNARVEINAGTVMTNGAIGGDNDKVVISGGKVNTNGSVIGGINGAVTISGGEVEADRIFGGGGEEASVTISGGIVVARGCIGNGGSVVRLTYGDNATESDISITAGRYEGMLSLEKPFKDTVTGTGFPAGGDEQAYAALREAESTLVPAKTVTVTLKAGDGSGEDVTVPVVEGTKIKLDKPDSFTAPKAQILSGWKDDSNTEYKVGDEPQITTDTTFTAQWMMTWASLDLYLSTLSGKDTIVLPNDVKALPAGDPLAQNESGDTHLAVNNNMDVTIDLNSFDLDGSALTGTSAYVIRVADGGKLTLRDNSTVRSGRLTGGTTSGVYLESGGEFTLESGQITGNAAGKEFFGPDGGGICVNSGATATIKGGSVTLNTAVGKGGGVYVAQGGTLNVSGTASVLGNTVNDADNNIYLASGAKINVTDALTSGEFHVITADKPSAEGPVVITNGLKGKGDASSFISDENQYTVSVNGAGEAVLSVLYTVSFKLGDQENVQNEPTNQYVSYYQTATEPSPAPTAQDGAMVVTGWQLNGEAYDFNTPVTGSIELMANWEKAITSVTETIPNETYNGLEHPVPLEVKSGDKVLTEGTDYTVTITHHNGEAVNGDPVDADTYNIIVQGAGEYIGTFEREFTITRIELQLVWSDEAEFEYDAQPHVPTATVTGVLDVDSDKDIYTLTVNGEQTDAGNNYTATAEVNVINSNYTISDQLEPKPFIIKPKPVNLVWGDEVEFTYDGKPHAPAATVDGLLGEDTCAVIVKGEETNAGKYQASVFGIVLGTNYVLATDMDGLEKDFEIVAKPVTLSWGETQFYYDGAAHAPTAAIEGLADGETCKVTVEGEQTDPGSYTATAKFELGENYTVSGDMTTPFTILEPPTSLTLSPTSAKLTVKKTKQLKATIEPATSATKLTWKSSNTKVATVSATGVVTAKAVGKATITVTTSNGLKKTCTVQVYKAPTGVKLNKKTATVKVKKTLTLKATVLGKNANPTVTWSSSNKKIATVSKKGVVKGIKPGKVTITVKTSNGKIATCVVTVVETSTGKLQLK